MMIIKFDGLMKFVDRCTSLLASNDAIGKISLNLDAKIVLIEDASNTQKMDSIQCFQTTHSL